MKDKLTGRQLTKRYSRLFEKKGLRNPFSFVHDVYRSGKSRELLSFAVWELSHRLRLFPKKKYLKFSNAKALTLENGGLEGSDFGGEIDRFFRSRGLSVTRSSHTWRRICLNTAGEILGCLYPEDRDLYKCVDNGKSIVLLERFPKSIESIFVSSQNTVFVCVAGTVYKGSEDSGPFRESLHLSSPESYFKHNNAMTETPSRALVIGEYGNIWGEEGWTKLAYLYLSPDNGETWQKSDFLIRRGINKHVHLVRYSSLLNKLLVADGDNKKKLWISDSLDSFSWQHPKWTPVNRFHIQVGGYTSIAESDGRILFGTDYLGGTNFVVESKDGKRFTRKVVPDPYRRSPIDNMVLRKSKNGSEIWANLSNTSANARCLLMYTVDGGSSWNKVIEYNGATHKVSLISSSNKVADVLYFYIEDLKNHYRVAYKVADQQ
jgi:hypothetical protein